MTKKELEAKVQYLENRVDDCEERIQIMGRALDILDRDQSPIAGGGMAGMGSIGSAMGIGMPVGNIMRRGIGPELKKLKIRR